MQASDWIFRLILAASLGAVVGLEREYHGRAAGLRTHMLVCLGAALITLAGVSLTADAGGDLMNHTQSRIMAGIVTGIGFLGAGAIIRMNTMIRGLTTAACIWFIAAVGITCGLGEVYYAAVSTGIALIILLVLPFLERYIASLKYREVLVRGVNTDTSVLLQKCRSVFNAANIVIHDVDIDIDSEEKTNELAIDLLFHIRIRNMEEKIELIEKLTEVHGVSRVLWQKQPRNL